METKFHQRLTRLQGDRSNAEFARKLRISPSTLQRYLEGSLPKLDAAASIALLAGVSLDWLVGSDGDALPPAGSTAESRRGFSEDAPGDQRMPPRVSLPRYDIQASAGHGALADGHQVADYLTVSRDWLHRYVANGARVVVIEARGDSMEPTVRHGDLLLVEMGIDLDDVAAGGVFVITVAGMVMVKRLQVMLNGDITISSDNQAYKAETIPAADRDEKLIVHGRVFWAGGPLGR